MAIRLEKGRYILDYYPHGRKGPRSRIRLPRGTTEQRAWELHDGLAKRKRNKGHTLSHASIKYLIPQYLAWVKRHQSPRTFKDKLDCFGYKFEDNKFVIKESKNENLLSYFGHHIIADLTNGLLSLYQQQRCAEYDALSEGQKNKHQTKDGRRAINKELAYFGGFLKWARRNLRQRPEERLEREDLPYRRPIPKIWTKEEVKKLIAATEPEYRAVFLALFRLLQRITPTAQILWDNVDLQTTAKKSTIIMIGKGNKENRLPLLDDLYFVIKRLKKERDRKPPEKRSKYLFPSPIDPHKPINNVRKALARARAKSGINKRIHPHLIRHSAATHMLEDGIDIRIIQSILGHSVVTTTEWYTHVSTELKRQAMEQTA